MKKILIATLLLTVANANMCTFYLKTSTKYQKLGNYESSARKAVYYLEMSREYLIKAQSECNERFYNQLEESIEKTNDKIERLK